MKIRKKLIITLSVSVSLCFVVGCGSNVKSNEPLVASSTQATLPEDNTYNLIFKKIKESKLDEADALLWKEIGGVYSVRLGDLPQDKQDLINLYNYIKVQKKLQGNDYINVVNYLNQLKPIDTLISLNERDSMLLKYQPLADRQWELSKSQTANKPAYTKEQLEKDPKAPSKDPLDYNKNGEYVPKNGVSKNPADYNAKGEYRPAETMTKEEKLKELEEMLKKAVK
ncbi:hypothetical protein [Paenibacillus radicis (ex Xue et al. 2023)]|uniref:Lipoprotein n=1 Tax=Paenibacillus radicis (ex Xue et al. 2023) TaxID=2972489 RepID=A0ABT1YL50_9BACL|nr:hypothetical protein [Paenibacillus radicis (ex Xue et al. 2023)]MCR8633901.1 hypothetical protein [Paenibacillus radicis (ex Xue et al. 2023)]